MVFPLLSDSGTDLIKILDNCSFNELSFGLEYKIHKTNA
jgi:hypothetical protein